MIAEESDGNKYLFMMNSGELTSYYSFYAGPSSYRLRFSFMGSGGSVGIFQSQDLTDAKTVWNSTNTVRHHSKKNVHKFQTTKWTEVNQTFSLSLTAGVGIVFQANGNASFDNIFWEEYGINKYVYTLNTC